MLGLLVTLFAVSFAVKVERYKADAPVVPVQLYYESCCPYCEEWIEGTFKTAWDTPGFINITNITFVPYGNARETYNSKTGMWEFSCQHGAQECAGNLVESCYVGLTNWDVNGYIPFVIDYEGELDHNRCTNADNTAESITAKYGISWDTLNACISGKQGNDFQHQMAVITNSLQPPHEYTPWIIVGFDGWNQIEQNECQEDLLKCVCQRYQGESPACDNYRKPTKDVCWK